MTESVAGHRTLAQLGAASSAPVPAGADVPTHVGVPLHVPTSTTTPRPAHPPFVPFDPAAGSSAANDARDGARPDGFRLLPFDVPSPSRLINEGGRGLLEFHPRDPDLRLTGRHRQPPADAVEPEPGEGDDAESSGGERSRVARTAMLIGIGGGFLMNGVDVARTVKKYPEALRAARFDPSLGKLGRLPTALALTAATRPDARLIDPTAPRIASAASRGMSFTRFDEVAMKSSVALGTSLAALQIASAIPNLADALSKDGPWYENLALSTSGRAGVLQLAGGTLGMGLFATALRQTRADAGSGVVNRVMAAAKAPVMAKPIFTSIGIGSAVLVMANELGYFDFLNTGEERSVGTVLEEAAHRTPAINDEELRTGLLLGAAGIAGYKTSRAVQAAGGLAGGGLAGLGKGHVVGGAIVAGLLGAQLLGGLGALDKPADG